MTDKEALKLAQIALDVVKLQYTQNRHINEAIAAIHKALAQPEQEPEWYHGVDQRGCNRFYHKTEVRPREFSTQLYIAPPEPEERNFCPRCGKRTADLTAIHTCTPPT
jgi:hypothetical protein